jgi:GT2 family glycosyltransferase
MLDQIGATATTQYEVVIVDNGSRAAEWRLIAAAAKRLRRQAPVTVVRNGRNLGYPAAANIGLRTATGRVLWLLNSDLEIGETGWDRRVLDFLDAHPTVGVISATSNMGAFRFGGEPVLERPAAGDHVNGCSFAIRRECWWQIGDFDEGFSPGLLEETDFCLRAWRAGWECWHLPADILHLHHGVVEQNIGEWPDALKRRNREYFTRKWAGATADLSGRPIVSTV